MSNEKNTPLRDFVTASLAVAADSGIWQMELLDEKKLRDFAWDKGLSQRYEKEDIRDFWQLGLISADLIVSDSKVEFEGLSFLVEDSYGRYFYQDKRKFAGQGESLAERFKNLPAFPSGIRLLFHPYRYFVLYMIEEEFRFNVSKLVILKEPAVFQSIMENAASLIRRRTSEKDFLDSFGEINRSVDIIVGCEPFTFRQLFGFYSFHNIGYQSAADADEAHLEKVAGYRENYAEFLQAIGLEEIKRIHSDLCVRAQRMEPNVKIHRLLRFTKKDFRLKDFKGILGGAMYLLAMAESLRRAAEEVFGTDLPEEDEVGYFYGVASNKMFRYGDRRMIDNVRARREFVRDFGLDYTVRLRWYVEGYTEFGALNLILGNHLNIELINLKGLIVAAGNKGLAFKENLLNDLKSGVYSWVMIDKDDKNCVNVLHNAVRAEEMFGMFFLSDPDFEFHNFTAGELSQVVLEWAEESGAVTPEQKENLRDLTAETKNGSEFFKAVNQALPYQPRIKKGVIWGERLSKYADDHPRKADTGELRMLIRAVRSARHSYNTSYHLGFSEGKVDIETGNIVYPRNQPTGDEE